MTATQDLIAAALRLAALAERNTDCRDEWQEAIDSVREACARAMVQPVSEVPMPEPTATFYIDEQTGRWSEYMRPPAKLTEGDARLYDGPALHAYGNACRTAGEVDGYARGLAAGGKDARPTCEKCGGSGWVRGRELDDADDATFGDTMTRYSCDRCDKCAALRGEVKP